MKGHEDMNNINITTELCAEDRARIDRLTAAVEDLVNTIKPPVIKMASFEEMAEALAHSPSYTNNRCPGGGPAEAPTEPETAPEEVGAPAEEPDVKEVPEHTKAELQQKVISLVTAGKKDEVKAIIEQYAERVSAIPDEKINEVWDKLTKLEG
jgi:hypothetical protein